MIPTGASIYWICTNGDINVTDDNIYFLFAISCLLLDIKFLLFFRAFELFGVYFVIIISVARKIASFLVLLFIILLSFAHAFMILLKPREIYSLEEPTNNNDPNNPWDLTDKFNQIENGTITNSTFIQPPDTSTNIFGSYRTSLFSMYLYLTGIINFLFISLFNNK